jgi:hypothetical protein
VRTLVVRVKGCYRACAAGRDVTNTTAEHSCNCIAMITLAATAMTVASEATASRRGGRAGQRGRCAPRRARSLQQRKTGQRPQDCTRLYKT